MQISPIQQNKNYNLKVSPSFTAIKSVKYKGLYKEYPEQVKILIDAFKNNKTAMGFCKKYDVKLVFGAYKNMLEEIESSLSLFIKNPNKGWFSKLISGKYDEIEIPPEVSKYNGNIKESLEKSTVQLALLCGYDNGVEEYACGPFIRQLTLIDEKIQKSTSKSNLNRDADAIKKQELENLIKDLIDSSK